MIKGTKGSKAYEKSEDHIYALENNCPIDYNYYIENQIKLPLIRIFDPIFGSESLAEKNLFTGDHVRNIAQAKVSSNIGLGKFTVVNATCMGCKKVLQKDEKDDVVCKNC